MSNHQDLIAKVLKDVEECRQQGSRWRFAFSSVRNAVEKLGIPPQELGISPEQYQKWRKADTIELGKYLLSLLREDVADPGLRQHYLGIRIPFMQKFLEENPDVADAELGLKKGERDKILRDEW